MITAENFIAVPNVHAPCEGGISMSENGKAKTLFWDRW